MAKRTHLYLSVKCGPTPTRKVEEDGGRGTVFNFLTVLHVIIKDNLATVRQ